MKAWSVADAMKYVRLAVFDKRNACYEMSEAVYHLAGGKAAGLVPMVHTKKLSPRAPKDARASHWWLAYKVTDGSHLILDPSVDQFGGWMPPYHLGRGCGFLTKGPSKKARLHMRVARAIRRDLEIAQKNGMAL